MCQVGKSVVCRAVVIGSPAVEGRVVVGRVAGRAVVVAGHDVTGRRLK